MDNKRVKTIFRDAFNFLQKHLGRLSEPEEPFWLAASADYSNLWNLHDGDPLAQALLLAAYEELERQRKAARHAN